MLLNFSGSSLRKFASANAAKLLMGGVATTAVISRMSVAKELEQLKRELANVDSSKPAGIDQLKTKYILVPYAMPNEKTERDLAATRQDLAKTKKDLQQREQELRTSHERKLETPNELESKGTKEELGRENEKLETKIEELDKKDKELQATRAELNTTKEELETMRKELRETKTMLKIKEEELKTTKEELKTTKEELKTTKEELKSDKLEPETSEHKEEKSSTEAPVNDENIVSNDSVPSTVAAAPSGSPPGPAPGPPGPPPGPPGQPGKQQRDFIDTLATNIPEAIRKRTVNTWRGWQRNMTSTGGTDLDELTNVITSLSYAHHPDVPKLEAATWSTNKQSRIEGLNKFRDTWTRMKALKIRVDTLNMSITDQTSQKSKKNGDLSKIDEAINNLHMRIHCYTAQLGPVETSEYKHDNANLSSQNVTLMDCDKADVAISNLTKIQECKISRETLKSEWETLQETAINNLEKLYTTKSSTYQIHVEWDKLVTSGNLYLTIDKHNSFLEECVRLKDSKLMNNSTSSFTSKFRNMLKEVPGTKDIYLGLDHLCETATQQLSKLHENSLPCLQPLTMWESLQHTILTSSLLKEEIEMLENIRDYNPAITELLKMKEYCQNQKQYIQTLASALTKQLTTAQKINEDKADLNHAQNVHVAFLTRKRIFLGDKSTKFTPTVPSIPYYMYYNGLQPLAQLEVIGKMLKAGTSEQKKQTVLGEINGIRRDICKLEDIYKSTISTRYEFLSNYLTSINDTLKSLTVVNPIDVLDRHIKALESADFNGYQNAKNKKITPVNDQSFKAIYAYDTGMTPNQIQSRDIIYKDRVKKQKVNSMADDAVISGARGFIIDDNTSPVGVGDNITRLLNTYESFQKNEDAVKHLDTLRDFVINTDVAGIFAGEVKPTYTYEQMKYLEELQIDILGQTPPPEITGTGQYQEFYEKPLSRYYFIPDSLPWNEVNYDFLHNALSLQKTLIDMNDDANIEKFQTLLKDVKSENISSVQNQIKTELERLQEIKKTVRPANNM